MDKITFTIIDPNKKRGEWKSIVDPSPYVHLENPEGDILLLQNRTEIVIPQTKIRILFDYPFDNEFIFEFTSENGFTRGDLAYLISKKYQEIYQEEDETTTVYEPNHPCLINRGRSNGKYGIWGHVLGDLDLCGVKYDANLDLYTLSVDS